MSVDLVLERSLQSLPAAHEVQLCDLFEPQICYGVLDRLGVVSVTDTKGRILYANDEFVRLSKYSRSELIGQDHLLLNSGYHPKEFFREMYRTIASGKMWRAPIKNRAKDSSEYWVDALVVPIKDTDGHVTRYLSVRLDITTAVGLHVSLQERDHLLQAILDNFPGGIAVYDKTLRMVVCNQRQKELLDYPETLFENGPPTLESLLRF